MRGRNTALLVLFTSSTGLLLGMVSPIQTLCAATSEFFSTEKKNKHSLRIGCLGKYIYLHCQ
jgi:hypothetical protein